MVQRDLQPRLSAHVQRIGDGEVLHTRDATALHHTASIGKVFLLYEVARRIEAGELDPALVLTYEPDELVADSGLWHRLATPTLPVSDLAVLIGAVSDNVATNVLLRHVGLAAVQEVSAALGFEGSRIEDRVREDRGPEHPPAHSRGRADELCALVAEIERPALLDPRACARVRGWLSLNTDQSMVAAAFGFDPLAHAEPDRGMELWSKTGTQTGVRAEIGCLRGPAGAVAYAVLASWEPDGSDSQRDGVLEEMRDVGERVRAAVNHPSRPAPER